MSARLTGTTEAVAAAIETLPVDAMDILGPVETGEGTVRTIVRFDYNAGTELAGGLRAEVVRAATRRRRPVPGKGFAGPTPPNLKVRFDDTEPFLDS